MNSVSTRPCELSQYRELGDQLAYSLDETVAMAVAAGYMEAAVEDN